MSAIKLEVGQQASTFNAQSRLCLAEFLNAEVKSSKSNVLKFQSYTSSNSYKAKRILVASNRIQYVGSNYEDETSKITSTVLKVAVFKKSTREIKLYDADLFHLKPFLKCHSNTNKRTSATEQTWSQKSEDLSLAFGSKNKVKAISSKRRNLSNRNTSINTVLNQPSILEDKTDVIAKQEPEAIPTPNKNATNASEIYDIYEIIPKDDYNTLDSEANVFVSATYEDIQLWKNNEQYCTFIIWYLEARFRSITIHNAKLLCYFHYMMCFVKNTYKDWRKKDPVPGVPQPFKKTLLNRYVLQRSMPPRMKDKLLAEAMVLALTMNNFVIDGKHLAASTQISIQRLLLIAYTLGCHVSQKKNENTKLIELKLPLYKYEPRSFKRK